jgi:hypothetical protein
MHHQNFANHRRFVPMFHGVLFFLILALLGGSITNCILSLGNHDRIYSASLLLIVGIVALFLFFFTRSFTMKVQDRAIRAEENLRHYVLTGKLLDSRLSLRQIIGLRFASDEEFVELARKAVEENLSEEAIKRAVKNWRGDYYRA